MTKITFMVKDQNYYLLTTVVRAAVTKVYDEAIPISNIDTKVLVNKDKIQVLHKEVEV